MKKTLIIVTDLGLFRAYLETPSHTGRPPSLKLLEEWMPEDGHQAPIHKQVLDALAPAARAKLSKVIASNLAKIDPGKLHGHFERQP